MAATFRLTAVLTILSLLGTSACWAQNSRQNSSSGNGMTFGETLRDMRDSLFGSSNSRQGYDNGQYEQDYNGGQQYNGQGQQRQNHMQGGNRPTRDNRGTSNSGSMQNGGGMRSGGSTQNSRSHQNSMGQRGQQSSSGQRDSSWRDRWFGGAFAQDEDSDNGQSGGQQRGNMSNGNGMSNGNRMSNNGMAGNRTSNGGNYGENDGYSDNGMAGNSSNRQRSTGQARMQPQRGDDAEFDPYSAETSEDGMNYAPPRVASSPRRATPPRVSTPRDDSGWHNADSIDDPAPPRTARARTTAPERRAPPVDVVHDDVPLVKRPASSRRTAQPDYRTSEKPAPAAVAARPAREDAEANADEDEVAPARRPNVAERRSSSSRTSPAPTELSSDEEPPPVRTSRRARPAAQVVVDDAETSEFASSDDADADEADSDEPIHASAGRAAAAAPRVASSARQASLSGGPQDFVVSNRSPVLQVETAGPRRMMVGKAATYKVSINNSAEVSAEDVTVMVTIPAWAEVLSKRATTGEAHESSVSSEGALEWSIPVLGARRHEELALEIVARENRSFELAVQWNYKPVATQTQVEVQEPKLELAVAGPDEVSYGEKTIYKLSFNNPGTADAEQVVVRLLPLGPGEKAVDSHTIGRVAAGATKVVEVELIARQEGELQIKVEAEAEGGLKAAASQDIRVLRAGLHVAVDAPKFRYTGAVVNYEVKVSNPGTETARDVQVTAQLPKGAKFVSCSDSGKRSATSDSIAWRVDFLKPREDRNLTIKCIVEQPGSNHFHVAATASGELAHSTSLTTQVEPVADLVLQVNDPRGAVPAGDTVTYELIVTNRGAKTASDVEVLAAFSDGVEPLPAADGAYVVEDGKVIFPAVAKLAGGEEHSFKIKARALVGGNHLIRAEVHCQELDISLAAEETTRFYGEAAEAKEPATRPTATDNVESDADKEAEVSEPTAEEAPSARYSEPADSAVVSEEEPGLIETAAPAPIAPPAAIETPSAKKSSAPRTTTKPAKSAPAR